MKRVLKNVFLSLLFVALAAFAFCCGITVSHNFSFADEPLSVTVQPISGEAPYGDSVVLYAEGATPASEPIEYTWYKVGDEVPVGAGQSFTVSTRARSGDYFCRLSATVDSVDRTVDTDVATATITPKEVKIALSSPSSVYGEALVDIEYRIADGYTLAYDDVIDDLGITATKKAGGNAGRYPITGTCANANYDVTFLPATYTITPKYLEGRLVGADELVYTGKTPTINAEIMGVPDGEIVNPILSFNKAVKDAGTYIAYIRTDNENYAITGEEAEFVIKKTALVVSIDDTILKVGDEMNPNFSYRGFVNGETDEVLAVKPKVSLTTDQAGLFETTPYGAEAKNYEISYREGTIQINVSSVVGENATATGSFSYNGSATVTTDDSISLNLNKLNVYSVKLQGTEADGVYTVTVSGVKKYPMVFLRGAIYDADGVRHGVTRYGYDGENLYYSADVTGTFTLYYDFTVPAIIIVGLILMFIIIAAVKGRDKRRYKKLRNRQYIAAQYADRCRIRDEE